MRPVKSVVFKSKVIYNDLCLSVFNIRFTKYNEKPKYSTKNNISDWAEVFLETKNHTSASTSSSRNFRLTAVIMCIVREAGSFERPRVKIITERKVIKAKLSDRMRNSEGGRSIVVRVMMSKPTASIRKVKRMNLNFMPVLMVTLRRYHLMKSLMAV